MSQKEQAEKDGASARALGRNLHSNPYYAANGMPSVTGEKFEEWHAKAVAWEVGWRAQVVIHPAGADAPQPQAALNGSYTAEQLEAIALVLRSGRNS
jgi:hypothetical protein